MCPEYLKPAKKPPRSSSSCGYTALGSYSRVWHDRHDACSWDKLFRALSTTSGMWSVIILGLIKMLLKTVSFDHLAVYLISEEHNLGKKHTTNNNGSVRTEQPTWTLSTRVREELEASQSSGWQPRELQLCPSANSWDCCHEVSLRAELHHITLCFNRERSHQRFK